MQKIKSYFNQYYHKIATILILILLVYLPFNAILQIIFTYKFQITGFQILKETLILILFFGNLFYFFLNRKLKDLYSLKFIFITILFLSWLLLSLIWAQDSIIQRLIYGFKYEGFFLLVMLTGLTLPQESLNKKTLFLKTAFVSGLVSIILGLVLHFIITPDNLTSIGYRNDWSTFYNNQSLAYCQKIEHNETCRFQGVFSGPNQAGANILLYFTLLLILSKKLAFDKKTTITCSIILATALFFTFSRSAWLAFFVGILLLGIYKKELKKFMIGTLVASLILGLTTFLMMPEKIIRMGSNSDRILFWIDSIKYFVQNPILGFGLAESGPASRFINKELITENWFLQIAINFGIVGLSIFSLLYYKITNSFLKNKDYFAFGILFIAILIPLNLLHTFEDSSFSYSLFLLVGILNNALTTDS